MIKNNHVCCVDVLPLQWKEEIEIKMTKITFDLEELQEFLKDLVYVSYDTADKGYNDHFL